MGFKDFLEKEPKTTLEKAISFLNKIGSETAHRGELNKEEKEKILNDINLSEEEREKLGRFIDISQEFRCKYLKELRKKIMSYS